MKMQKLKLVMKKCEWIMWYTCEVKEIVDNEE